MRIKEAGQKNADLVCFGEYAFQGKEADDYEKDIKVAETVPGVITSRLSELASQYSLNIIAGILEREREAIYDSAVLINHLGEIVLKYRRINPQWHGLNADKNQYRQGDEFRTTSMPFGKVGIVLCGDFFDDSVLTMVKKTRPDILVVPVAIPIAQFDPAYGKTPLEKWGTYKREWTDQAKNLGITCILVNSVSDEEKGSHSGGAMIVSSKGKVLVEAEIGKEMITYYEIPQI